MSAAPKDYYSRLFVRAREPSVSDEEYKLVELANSMGYNKEREGTLTPRIGYTSFGRFLGHDLTHDATPLAGPYREPENTPNFRTSTFDLDRVYGDGPAGSAY
jgi:hypothetical protein